eukprot:3621749-Alexandrium_andersonii.AAC.1
MLRGRFWGEAHRGGRPSPRRGSTRGDLKLLEYASSAIYLDLLTLSGRPIGYRASPGTCCYVRCGA